jgi:uncharacterized protein (TIGR02466 family)
MINLFSNLIGIYDNDYHSSLEEPLANQCLDIKEKYSKGGKGWLVDTYNTLNTYDLVKDKNFNILTEWIDSCVLDYCRELEYSDKINHRESWFNVYLKGDYQECHEHSNFHISAIYCLKGDNNSAKIFFKRKSNMFLIPIKKYNSTNCEYYSVPFTAGTLYIFESSLTHYVEKHNLDKPRISLAYNYRLQ